MSSSAKRMAVGLASVFLASIVWLPVAHLFFKPHLNQYITGEGIPAKARQLAAQQLEVWSNPELKAREIARMRSSNAEWDFMSRTFLVLALANMGLREPAGQARYLSVMDTMPFMPPR